MRIGLIAFTALLLVGCISDMIKYRYSYTDHKILISGEKPKDMKISAKVRIRYFNESCYIKNQAGGENQPHKTDYLSATESEDRKHYQIEVPVNVEEGNCDPYFSGILIYGQNKVYDMNLLSFGTINSSKRELISLKTDDHFVATCGRQLFIDRKYITSSYCSLELNSEEIVPKYGDNETNYIPILQNNLNDTTEIILDVKKDQYYQSEKNNPPPVPEGVRYSNYYK